MLNFNMAVLNSHLPFIAWSFFAALRMTDFDRELVVIVQVRYPSAKNSVIPTSEESIRDFSSGFFAAL
jgi:hypothetical protein